MPDGKVWMALVEVGEEYLQTVVGSVEGDGRKAPLSMAIVVSGESRLYYGCQVSEEEVEEFLMRGMILEIAFAIVVEM
jgi:hypothetical protein